MSSVQIILGMGTLALVASACESISEVLGQTKIANYIRVSAIGAGIITTIGIITKALEMFKDM